MGWEWNQELSFGCTVFGMPSSYHIKKTEIFPTRKIAFIFLKTYKIITARNGN